MKQGMKSTLVLFLICSIIAVLMAVTNMITKPIIEANEKEATKQALLQVLPDGGEFDAVDLAEYELPATVKEVYKATQGGVVVKLVTTGYGSNFTIMCGIGEDGKVVNAICLSSNETLGYEKTFGENLIGKNADEVEGVSVVSGATKTTSAYKNAVKDALTVASILSKGGEAA